MDWENFSHYPIHTGYGTYFHGILMEFIRTYVKQGSLLLFCEPEDAIPYFSHRFPSLEIENIECQPNAQGNFEYDLNKLFLLPKTYDCVFSQATIEHVCRPSTAIENFSNMCKVGGHIILHTHSPRYPYHKHPVDCVRFFKDFFVCLQKYLPLRLVVHNEVNLESDCRYSQHYVVYEKI